MQNDFDHLDVLVNKTDPQENEEPMLLEVNTDIVTENENMESEKEESQEVEEMKSVKLSIWRTSEPHGSCIVCPVADSTSRRVLSNEQRTMVFLSRSIWVPKDIICALINKYQCPAVKDIENGREIAMKMHKMLTTENRLQERLAKDTGTTSLHWTKHNAANFQFPPRTEQKIHDLTFECCNEHDDLVRARFQSRHSNSKNHIATVQFDHHKQQPTDAWYCTCSAAAREVGMCSHVTALRWHLGVNKAVISTDNHPLSASRLIKAIDDSTHFSEDDLS
ncbi:unnamed protein product [Rotaria socialis]